MKNYETVFVLHPHLDEAKVEEEIQKVKDVITQNEGTINEVQKWGRKRLAFEINKVHEGIYTLIQFQSKPSAVQELDRKFKLNEEVLRHLTVLAHPKYLARSKSDQAEAEGRGGQGDAFGGSSEAGGWSRPTHAAERPGRPVRSRVYEEYDRDARD